MAMVRVRHASIWLGGRKLAEMYKTDTELASGDEPQYGDEGFVGMSDGATTTTIDFDVIVPISGMTVAVEQAILNKSDVDVTSGLINGKLWQLTMRCTKAKYSSDVKPGTLTGSFTFMGGKPSLS